MNFDEETYLTAYLDGELAAAPRERVESALASDPRAADDLRALTAVRDLVAGLARPPAPADLSAAVVARLARRRGGLIPRAVLGRLTGRAWPVRAAALLATAAALVAAVTVGLLRPPAGRPSPGPGLAARAPDAGRPRTDPAPNDSRAANDLEPPADLLPGREERQRSEESLRFRRLLDSPHLHRVFEVTDVLGGDAVRQVGLLLEKTPRREATFGRITVSQGIVIDPAHPGKATVYAVVMDDGEMAAFRELMARRYPSAVRESDPRPEVVTQLADIGQVAVLPGTPVATLVDTRAAERDRAIRATPGKDHMAESRVVPEFDRDPLHDPFRFGRSSDVASNDQGPTLEQMRSGPHPMLRNLDVASRTPPRDAAPAKSAPAPPLARPKLHVVLVCVWSPPDNQGAVP